MEGTYACNLNNRFELFLDDENDPLEILAKSQQEKRKGAEKSKDSKKDAKKKGLSKTLKESVKTIAAAVDSNESRIKAGSTSPTQGGGGGGFGGAPRPPRRDNLERRNNERNFEPRPDGDRPPRENRGPRDGNRPPRNFDGPRPEGGRSFRNRDDGNRGSRDGQRSGGRGRDFDRHSGDVRSGVKATEKRGGQGAHNWGKATEFDSAPEQDSQITDTSDVAPEVENAAEEPAVPAEPEAIQMTLEQWKKEQASKAKKTEYAANIRKPNEGEKEDPKLKKAVVLKKLKAGDEDSDDADGDDGNDAEDECEKLKKELEQTLASQFHFADFRGPARGGRGGRPEGRGLPGPRRSDEAGFAPASRPPRGGKPQHTPRVEDLNDFPSLAA